MLIGKVYLHLSANTIADIENLKSIGSDQDVPANWREEYRDVAMDVDGQRFMVEAASSGLHDYVAPQDAEKRLRELAATGAEISIDCYKVQNDIVEPVGDYPGGIIIVQHFIEGRCRVEGGFWVNAKGERFKSEVK